MKEGAKFKKLTVEGEGVRIYNCLLEE